MAAITNATYQRILAYRQDMTQWLIHFTRPNQHQSALDVLKTVLTEGVLRPSFAERGGRNTIYGNTSAVCFTEQPIGSMIQYLNARNEPNFLSGYGIIINKLDLYAAGGLPVIYGLNNSTIIDGLFGSRDGTRNIDPNILSPDEQYRYVAFNPYHGIDWTHEREWRWPSSSEHADRQALFFLAGLYANEKGCFKGEINAFVDRDIEINEIQEYFKAINIEDQNQLSWHGRPYHKTWKETLDQLKLVSLETIRRDFPGNNPIKFENLNAQYFSNLV